MFNVNSMLADMARVANGKLDLWGGGWSITSPGSAFAVCGKIDVPWHLRHQKHTLRLELIDTDGNAVSAGPPGDEKPVVIDHPPYDLTEVEFNVKPGTPIDWPFAVNIVGLPLPAGSRFEWRIFIDGDTEEGWTLPFSTRPEDEPGALAA